MRAQRKASQPEQNVEPGIACEQVFVRPVRRVASKKLQHPEGILPDNPGQV